MSWKLKIIAACNSPYKPRLPVWSFNLFFFCVIDCCVILSVNRKVSGGHLYDCHPTRKCEVLSDKVELKLSISEDVGCKFLPSRSLHAGAVLKDAPGRDSRSGRGHLTPASNRNRNTTALFGRSFISRVFCRVVELVCWSASEGNLVNSKP